MTTETSSIRSARRWWSWPLLILGIGICVAQVAVFVAGVTSGRIMVGGLAEASVGGTVNPIDVVLTLQPLMWSLPGLVILVRADWHPVGWMLILSGIGFGISFDLSNLALWEGFGPGGRAWVAWVIDGWGVDLSFVGIVLLLSVFPDGLGPRGSAIRRWRRIRVVAALGTLVFQLLRSDMGGFEGNTFSESYGNPTGLGIIPTEVDSLGGLAGQLTFVLVLVLLVSALWSLRRRSRSVDPVRHRQYTWVLFPFGALVGFTVLALFLAGLLGNGVWLPVVFTYLTIPVAFSMAMVRYRWFDIDRLVSRTVTYAVVAAVVIAVYAIPVLVLPEVLGLSGDLTIAGATLLAAAAFAPIRIRVQRVVARRFDRAHYDAERLLEDFAGHIQTATEVGRLTAEVGGVLQRALGPRTIAIWVTDAALSEDLPPSVVSISLTEEFS